MSSSPRPEIINRRKEIIVLKLLSRTFSNLEPSFHRGGSEYKALVNYLVKDKEKETPLKMLTEEMTANVNLKFFKNANYNEIIKFIDDFLKCACELIPLETEEFINSKLIFNHPFYKFGLSDINFKCQTFLNLETPSLDIYFRNWENFVFTAGIQRISAIFSEDPKLAYLELLRQFYVFQQVLPQRLKSYDSEWIFILRVIDSNTQIVIDALKDAKYSDILQVGEILFNYLKKKDPNFLKFICKRFYADIYEGIGRIKYEDLISSKSYEYTINSYKSYLEKSFKGKSNVSTGMINRISTSILVDPDHSEAFADFFMQMFLYQNGEKKVSDVCHRMFVTSTYQKLIYANPRIHEELFPDKTVGDVIFGLEAQFFKPFYDVHDNYIDYVNYFIKKFAGRFIFVPMESILRFFILHIKPSKSATIFDHKSYNTISERTSQESIDSHFLRFQQIIVQIIAKAIMMNDSETISQYEGKIDDLDHNYQVDLVLSALRCGPSKLCDRILNYTNILNEAMRLESLMKLAAPLQHEKDVLIKYLNSRSPNYLKGKLMSWYVSNRKAISYRFATFLSGNPLMKWHCDSLLKLTLKQSEATTANHLLKCFKQNYSNYLMRNYQLYYLSNLKQTDNNLEAGKIDLSLLRPKKRIELRNLILAMQNNKQTIFFKALETAKPSKELIDFFLSCAAKKGDWAYINELLLTYNPSRESISAAYKYSIEKYNFYKLQKSNRWKILGYRSIVAELKNYAKRHRLNIDFNVPKMANLPS